MAVITQNENKYTVLSQNIDDFESSNTTEFLIEYTQTLPELKILFNKLYEFIFHFFLPHINHASRNISINDVRQLFLFIWLSFSLLFGFLKIGIIIVIINLIIIF